MITDIIPLYETWGQVKSTNDPVSMELHEGKTGKVAGATYLEGVFMQAEVVNGNGRLYPKRVLESAINQYNESQVLTGQALGELNHPDRPTPDPREAAIIIESLWFEGNDVHGRARVLETKNGQTVKALLEGGWVPGVSSRGLGRLKKNDKGINEVQEGFKLTVGVDVVWGQSAPDARPGSYTVENLQEADKKTHINNIIISEIITNIKNQL